MYISSVLGGILGAVVTLDSCTLSNDFRMAFSVLSLHWSVVHYQVSLGSILGVFLVFDQLYIIK